ncbi:FecR family protein [Sphingomonas endolithica]|uniref:FecR family protein n=1 Tax=Sphingomonas endolithica TaxID=2972485 RepID=UPI0021B001EA|nr:FecR domain-containing protein [Sphingomonas sp. ZFBP2030]
MTRRAAPHKTADAGILDDPALGEALAAVAATGRLSNEALRGMRETRRRVVGTGISAVLVASVGLGFWQGRVLQPAAAIVQHIETQRGEQRAVNLADGSRVDLDGATSLDVRINDGARVVDLRRGAAYFDVAHDRDRPFVVRAGASSTNVLGTAFSIDIGARAVKLSVYRGRVRFGDKASGSRGVDVPAGWRSSFVQGAVAAPTRFDATQQDRRQSWVDTDDMLLGELVEQLNRRRGPLIEPPPPHLASLPLSGRFKLDDAADLLEAIGEVYGFDVIGDGGSLRLVAAGKGDAKLPSK